MSANETLSTAAEANLAAAVNYLAPMQDHPVAFSYNRQAGNLEFDRQTVTLRDMRSLGAGGDLDRQGFTLRRLPLEAYRGADAGDYSLLRAAATELVTELTRPFRMKLLGPFIRHSDPALAQPGKTPAYYIHGDYTANSFVRAAEEMLEGDPDRERCLEGRYAILQLWTPLSPSPQDNTLAILDRSTLRPADIVEGTVVVGTQDMPRPHPALLYRHSSEHAWYHVPKIQPGDAIVFIGYDNSDMALPGCPHTAVDTGIDGAIRRVSAEMRAFVFWGN